jgi:acyl dehydratase
MTDQANAGSNRSLLYLEDLQVGQKYATGSHTLTKEEILAFASQFDPQPFHLDEDAAKTSFFGELVASGWHTAGITMRLLVQSGLPIAGGSVGMGAELAWPRPTLPGSVLRVESEILELRPLRSRPDKGLATVRSETKNQAGEVVQTLTARLIVPRRNPA